MTEETKMDKLTTEMAEMICDHICKYTAIVHDQEMLDSICCECPLGQFYADILNEYNKVASHD